jgi:hypothetical protein
MQMLHRPLLATVLLAAPLQAQIQVDDILVSFIGSPGLAVHRPDGTLVVQAGALTGTNYQGVAQTPEGLLVTTRGWPADGLDFIDMTGTEVRTFDTPQTTTIPGDVSVFSDGTLAVVDQSGDVDLWDPAGNYQGSITAPGMVHPVGIWIDASDDLWVVDMLSGVGGIIWHFDRAGVLLGSFSTSFGPGDMLRAPDGTLWVTDRLTGLVYHLDAAGAVLGSFQAVSVIGTSNFFYGLALASDGTLWATALNESLIYHYDAAGTLLGSFPISGTLPVFLMTAQSASGLSGSPESISLSAGGSQVLFIDLDDGLVGKSYQVLGSVTGTQPGITYTDVLVPLNVDPYLIFTLLNPNTPPLSGSSGTLNSLGQATAVLTLPPASDPSLAGLVVNHAAIVLDVVGGSIVILESTNAADLLLVP